MIKKYFFSFFVMSFLLIIVFSCNSFSAEYEWRFGSSWAPGALDTKACDKFVEMVEERTDGKMVINHFTTQQLGDSLSRVEMISYGDLEINAETFTWHSRLMDEFAILGFPYVIRDNDHLARVYESKWFKDLLEKYAYEHGVRVIALNGYRTPRVLFFRSKVVITPNDIVGVKLRKADAAAYAVPWVKFGADVQIIPWVDVPLALETKMIDGAGQPAHSVYPAKLHQIAPHISLTFHQIDSVTIMVSEKLWQKLPKEIQDIMIESANEALDWYSDEISAVWEEQKKLIEEDGGIFHQVDVEAWLKKGREVNLELEKEGFWGKGLFELIQNM